MNWIWNFTKHFLAYYVGAEIYIISTVVGRGGGWVVAGGKNKELRVSGKNEKGKKKGGLKNGEKRS